MYELWIELVRFLRFLDYRQTINLTKLNLYLWIRGRIVLMITKWSVSSWMVIFLRLVIILQLYHLTLICWIVLEIFTWSLFFLFFIKYSKVLTNHLFLFFIIQTSCRFIWLLRTIIIKVEINDNLFTCVISIKKLVLDDYIEVRTMLQVSFSCNRILQK